MKEEEKEKTKIPCPEHLKQYRYGTRTDIEKVKQENSKGGRNRINNLKKKGQFKKAMNNLINYKLLEQEPRKLKKLFADFINDKLNQLSSSSNKTYREKIIDRMFALLFSSNTSNMEFLKAFDMVLEITGEKKKDKTLIIQNTETNEINIEKLKEIKELLNGNNKQS